MFCANSSCTINLQMQNSPYLTPESRSLLHTFAFMTATGNLPFSAKKNRHSSRAALHRHHWCPLSLPFRPSLISVATVRPSVRQSVRICPQETSPQTETTQRGPVGWGGAEPVCQDRMGLFSEYRKFQGPISIEDFRLEFWLEKYLSHFCFGLGFPSLRTCSKMGSLDVSAEATQAKFFLLNRLPEYAIER